MAERRTSVDVKAALVLAFFLTVGGALVGGSVTGILLVPIIFLLLFYAMFRSPLRDSLLVLMFFAFTLENPAEQTGAGVFETPFRIVGAILLTHLNTVDRANSALGSLAFSGAELILWSLLVIALVRRLTGSKIDLVDRVRTPEPLMRIALLSLAGAGFVWFTGMIRGGDFRFSLWQVNAVLYLPVIFILFGIGLRGPKDHTALAKVLVGAATVRAIAAIYIQHAYPQPPDPETGSTKLAYATSHHDSMLFAGAFVILLALILERAGKKATRLAFVLMPILIWGMISNNRRMVWVQVGVVMFTVYLVAPDNVWKRRIRRALMVIAPVIALYLIIGWDHKYGNFWKPVAVVRSVVDTKSDNSTFWRQLENYDLITTVQHNPLLGAGYGNPYEEVIVLPVVPYDLERYLPHNSILGLWCYCGYLGYTAITMLWAGGVYFGLRAYHSTKDPKLRVAALASFGSILIYMVQCWGDMGLGTWTGIFMVGPGLAVAGKLAVATGAWATKKTRAGGRERLSSAPGVAGTEQVA
jgi:hypothetical protein